MDNILLSGLSGNLVGIGTTLIWNGFQYKSKAAKITGTVLVAIGVIILITIIF